MSELQRVLIANRGEIARRIIRTCHSMGLETVAVFSDADAQMPFVEEADCAVRIGPASSAESYLCVEKILDAATRSGADAIHPGYGFLAENADFAQACLDAGLTFIGPSPEVIRVMGSKIEAKARATAAGVPIVPGYNGAEQSTEALSEAATRLGFPLLLKASAGGGGKGMRILRDAEDLAEAIDAARREALNAFGDDALMIERYIERPRHIEFQILGDQHGTVLHLGERECSIQRRHQKIIEETPSPALSVELRAEMGAAAVALGEAIGYTNAGTVEFILDEEGRFYFLEVNTRLQVEHPVTECVTGIDLVREQLRVARGEALELGEIVSSGASIECRLYAEDTDRQFLPSTGRLVSWSLPALDGVRVDAGVAAGSEVGIHYDPMLAKIITHAPTRPEAIDRMRRALTLLSAHGIITNRLFLIRILNHPAFRAGALSTHFIDEHLSGESSATSPDPRAEAFFAIAATLHAHQRRQEDTGGDPLTHITTGFRNNFYQHQRVTYLRGEDTIEVRYRVSGRGVECLVGEQTLQASILSCDATTIELEVDGLRRRVQVIADGARRHLQDPLLGVMTLTEQPRFPIKEPERVIGGCLAPMPGKVIVVSVSNGEEVEEGATLLVLEAMKMEHVVKAPQAGTIERLLVDEGDQVDADALLVVITPNEPEA